MDGDKELKRQSKVLGEGQKQKADGRERRKERERERVAGKRRFWGRGPGIALNIR